MFRGAHRSVLAVLAGTAVGIVLIDQVTKAWAVTYLRPRIESSEGPIYIIDPLLRLTYVENTGAAWGMGAGYTWIFTIVAVVVGVVIVRFARTITSRAWALALGGLLGGLLGNLIDRLTRPPGPGLGSVVDFIGLPNFPVFNVADMAITCSAVAMIILAWRGIPLSESEPDGSSSDDSNSADSSSNDPRSKESASQAPISTDEPSQEDELRHDDTPAAGSGP
ncbi:MAG: signal peptidase II [Actinomycetota bacterium]|nr:signal peptidase II [Actinomycetota bacterium]MEC7590830.1 signal peptidase II [Actinomycetota bacterium]MEC8648868.1 signal peptidase II [Actinomycetota bacterium]